MRNTKLLFFATAFTLSGFCSSLSQKEGTSFKVVPIYNIDQGKKKGSYDYVYNWISQKNCPIKKEEGRGEAVEVELIQFKYYINTGDVIKELNKMGYRPADTGELLGFGAQYPKEQRKYSIIALGSVFSHPTGNRYTIYLCCINNQRALNLSWLQSGWYSNHWRFLAVRLPSGEQI